MKELTKKEKVFYITAFALVAVLLTATANILFPEVMAADGISGGATNIVKIIYKVLKYIAVIVGVIFFLSGVMGYVVARQNENGPDEHKAVTKMAVGLILTLLFTVIIKENWAVKTINDLLK